MRQLVEYGNERTLYIFGAGFIAGAFIGIFIGIKLAFDRIYKEILNDQNRN